MKWKEAVARSPEWLLTRRVSSFQRFFELGGEESASPFLDTQAKKISRNLALKSACLAAVLLFVAAVFRYCVTEPLWVIPLAFVFLLVGTPALVAASQDVIERKDVNIDVLNTLAAFGALLIGSGLEGGLLLVLFALAGSLEDMVTLKAKSALCAMYEFSPTRACVVGEGGYFTERAVDDVRVGEKIAVRSGEIVPLDGKVVKGQATVSLAHITGESAPLSVGVGQNVVSGARVGDGSIEVEVTLSSHDSTVAHLVALITRAHSSKPKLSQLFERWNRLYALSVIGCSAALLLVLPWLLGISFAGEGGSIIRSVSFLITASPCALILAVPITYLGSLGASARKGAILKGSTIIDRIALCDVVAFDKTGTLTEGRLGVEKMVPLNDESHSSYRDVLRWAASLERHAVHPIAGALVEASEASGETPAEVEQVHVVPGEGVSGMVAIDGQKRSMFIGGVDPAFRLLGVRIPSVLEEERYRGRVLAVLVIERKEAYVFVLHDALRLTSKAVVQDLKNLDKHVVLLTGDNAKSAQLVAKSLGIDEVQSELTPEQKMETVAALSAQRGVLMVGDGINDAPALARSTVGVSMGKLSSATAREASDVVLLNNDLSLLVWLFAKAGQTRAIVRQNVSLAILSMIVGITTALQGILPLWMAVTIHEGSTLLVGLNALRLLAL
jgi:heavy metal translocating P-type ATPase